MGTSIEELAKRLKNGQPPNGPDKPVGAKSTPKNARKEKATGESEFSKTLAAAKAADYSLKGLVYIDEDLHWALDMVKAATKTPMGKLASHILGAWVAANRQEIAALAKKGKNKYLG